MPFSETLSDLRRAFGAFIRKERSYSEFRDDILDGLIALEEPYWSDDWAELGPNEVEEAVTYVRWTGGTHGETEHLIPQQPQWRYGENQEPYVWVDGRAYRADLANALRAFLDRSEDGVAP